MSTLPSRLSESNFRQYERAIATIVSRHPLPTTFNPKDYGRTVGTFEHRLRDAILSHFENHWPTDLIDNAKFAAVQSSLVVSVRRDGTILVGTRENIAKFTESLAVFAPAVTGTSEAFAINPNVLPDKHSVDLLCYLAHNRLLTQPLRLHTLHGFTVVVLQNSFDVLIETNADGTYTLI